MRRMTNPKNYSSTTLVTEGIFDQKLTEFAKTFSKELIKKLQPKFDRLESEISSVKQDVKDFKTKSEEFQNRVDEILPDVTSLSIEVKQFKEDAMGKFADISGEIQGVRNEQKGISYYLSEHTNQLERHEKSITSIRKHLQLA